MLKRYNKDKEYSYTLGTTLTIELLNKKIELVENIFIHSKQENNETLKKILNTCKENNIEVILSDKIFNTLTTKENIFIIGMFKKFTTDFNTEENHLVLDSIANMGNLGTIIRTSVGFGVKNIIIIEPSVDIFNPKVIRASMGAIFNVNFKYYKSFKDYQKEIKERAYYPFMLDGATTLNKIKIKKPFTLIFGNESSGLDKSYKDIGTPVFIKHNNLIDSLNLNNAVSIALYEFTKQKDN